MKKLILSIAALAAAISLASCDSKMCKCYIYNGQNTPYVETEYVQEGTACSALDYNRGTQYRTCLEYNEPDIDPNGIGQEYKKIK